MINTRNSILCKAVVLKLLSEYAAINPFRHTNFSSCVAVAARLQNKPLFPTVPDLPPETPSYTVAWAV